MNLEGQYNAKKVEDRIYRLWEDSGFFNPDNLPKTHKKKFTTPIAPPNITGELHMGHALELTMQDILVRMKRMQGYKTLWIPGIDHAGIAAQNVVEKQLKKEGLSRHDLGREKFVEKVQEWKEKYGNSILSQFKKLGISVDWSRTRYTRDEGYEKAVREAFKQYYDKGWIYKGYRVINWCPRCATGISDLEVNYAPEKGKLYFIKYGPFAVATVRPETKLGDAGLAVNPADNRYKDYVGKDLEIESVDNSVPADNPPKIKKIKIKVVADRAVDKEFGTGVIKITPAHDFADFEISQKHNLPLIKIIDEKGRMNENAGSRYQGMKVAEARAKILQDLKQLGLLEKTEDYEHNIAKCDRCNSVVEPLPSDQWFLKTTELLKLAKHVIAKKEVSFYPEKWKNISLKWIENMKDWNISRQLWWGHKIPIEGEEDVLDTWFSSALWPFAILGWPEKTKDLEEYYPTDFITSARDILFLWQIRMIFSGKLFTGKAPFKKIYIHPTILTKDGQRMSKSLGTGVDPSDLIEKYGTDALRFGLAYQNTGVQDLKFAEDHILMGKKFANKFWNMAKYVLMKLGDEKIEIAKIKSSAPIVKKLNKLSKEISKKIDGLNFGEASHQIYDFIWHEFADKYIEETKTKDDKKTKDTLAYLLINCLIILHPFMPFITEEIYQQMPIRDKKKCLMIEKWLT
ncbi:MAG: class I tRNA ligase family protein [Patescibacteria group bacterium]